MIRHARQFIRDTIELAYPSSCIVCSAPADTSRRFCESCDDTLTQMEDRPQCLACGAPIAAVDMPCQRCEGRGYRLFGRIIRLGVFEGPLQLMVLRYKFYHSWTIGELLADRAWRLPRVRSLLDETDVLVPIPLHPWRQIVRGFNQAHIYTAQISYRSRVPVRSPLIRIRKTKPQTRLTSKKERAENVKNAFALVSPQSIEGKRVTIVDDVTTTAATLKSAAQQIKNGGAAHINVLTIAIADPKNRQFEAV